MAKLNDMPASNISLLMAWPMKFLIRVRNGTDGSLLASLPWTLVAISFAALPHTLYIPIWITATFAVCALSRLYIEKNRKRLPPAWLRVILALLSFIGVLATYQNVAGVGPGSALLVIMAAMKLMETRQRRDQFVLLFISIFLIMSALLREQFIWSLPFLVIGIIITMTAWLRMSDCSGVALRQSFATSGRLILLATPMMLAMWVLFPRLSSPFWSVPVDSGRAKSGLSDSMSPGDISSLSLSKKVAFRVDFLSEKPKQSQLYWRGLVLHHFNGRTWTGNDSVIDTRDKWPVEYFGDPVRYQITIEPTAQQWVYALDIPYEWTIDATLMGQQQQLVRRRPIDQRMAYAAISYTSYRMDNAITEQRFSYYLRLPDKSNPETSALARSMRAAARDDESYVRDVLSMFSEQEFYYTLQPPALGNNSVDRFLFDTRRGFCEHYASAFAVLMRAAGIPARVVLGYQGGEFNAMGQYLIVRQSDAHAWTEVWLPERGWIRIDPTAAVAPERISDGFSGMIFDADGVAWRFSESSQLLHNVTLAWDALNEKWNDWILGYGPENQNKFLQWLGMSEPNLRQMILTLLAIVALLIGAISFALILRYRPPVKDEAAVLYGRFTSRIGVAPSIGETPIQYAVKVRNDVGEKGTSVDAITQLYLDSRYGPENEEALEALRTEVRKFAVR